MSTQPASGNATCAKNASPSFATQSKFHVATGSAQVALKPLPVVGKRERCGLGMRLPSEKTVPPFILFVLLLLLHCHEKLRSFSFGGGLERVCTYCVVL